MVERGRPRGFDRAAALARAMEVFWAKGYDGASIADLTAAMAINSPSLYAAFGSKEALFREAVALYAEKGGAGIWEAIPTAPTAREAMERFLLASADAFTEPGRPAGCMIVLAALNPSDANAGVCAELRRQRASNAEMLRGRLERAVAQGEIAAGVDCGAVAAFYATVQHGMSIQARDGASRDGLRGVARSAMAAWDALTGVPAARA